MIIEGNNFSFIDTIDNPITVADSWVINSNKLGAGNGEAKLYVGSKDLMEQFHGGTGFVVSCFVLKKDLLAYMEMIKDEYFNPSQEYRKREELPDLWQERVDKIHALHDINTFTVVEQEQITGSRGYVNSTDSIYKLIREISLPLVSYLSIMKLEYEGHMMFYWKLFADYEEIEKRKAFIYSYGSSISRIETSVSEVHEDTPVYHVRNIREGQEDYRKKLLEECPFCPITMINEESLLIASHIKPWALSDPIEKIDPNNGLILSPLYDKLFDRGFITFNDDKRVVISNWLSRQVQGRIGISNNQLFQFLPLNSKRCEYLDFHRQSIFKG